MESAQPLIMLAVFGGMFYFFFIRPQTQREKEHKKFVEALERGDAVVTVGGMCGRVSKLDGAVVTLEVGDGTEVTVLRERIQHPLGEDDAKKVQWERNRTKR